MALLHRRPVLSGSILLILCAATTLGAARLVNFWPFAPTPFLVTLVQEQPPQYSPLNAVTATQIAELRAAAGLSDDALTACNFGDSDLEAILAAVRTWFGSNSSAWITNAEAIADKQALIRGYDGEISRGVDRASVRTDAVTALATLQATRDSLLADLRTAALHGMSQPVKTLIDQMRSPSSMSMPYRVLALNDDQKTQITQAQSRFGQRCSATADASEIAQAQADFDGDILSIIGENNATSLYNLSQYQGLASERIVAAVKKVLPVEQQE